MKVARPHRSFRYRVALLACGATAFVVLFYGALMHEWLRRDLIRSTDRLTYGQSRMILSQYQRPIIWHLVGQRLEEGSGISVFAYLEHPGRAFLSEQWPKGLDPADAVTPDILPRDWRERVDLDVFTRESMPPRGLSLAAGAHREPDRAYAAEAGEQQSGRDLAPNDLDRAVQHDAIVLQDPKEIPGYPGYRFSAYTDGTDVIVMAANLDRVYQELARFRRATLLLLPGILVFSFVAGFLVAERTMRSIEALGAAMKSTTAAGLDQRLDPASVEEEFAVLVKIFNDMLGRLERGFGETRRFADNAAHELRTPLTILQGKIDAAIQSEAPGSERQQFLSELLEETARLKGITDRLLLLARSDAGRLELFRERVDLSQLLDSMIEDAAALAPQLRIRKHLQQHVQIALDRSLIAQVVHNMLSNAIKYNVATDGWIRIDLAADEEFASLTVTNSTRPIPAEQQPRLFERFFRGDDSHSRRVQGTGLGLSLAREIARAHGGDLLLLRSDERGTSFQMNLPLAGRDTSGFHTVA